VNFTGQFSVGAEHVIATFFGLDHGFGDSGGGDGGGDGGGGD
jgi:hypothetical protein